MICYIHEERKNLVGILNAGPGYHQRASGANVSQWYIFNDFRYVITLQETSIIVEDNSTIKFILQMYASYF